MTGTRAHINTRVFRSFDVFVQGSLFLRAKGWWHWTQVDETLVGILAVLLTNMLWLDVKRLHISLLLCSWTADGGCHPKSCARVRSIIGSPAVSCRSSVDPSRDSQLQHLFLNHTRPSLHLCCCHDFTRVLCCRLEPLPCPKSEFGRRMPYNVDVHGS